jgi:prolyl oligopeptidase
MVLGGPLIALAALSLADPPAAGIPAVPDTPVKPVTETLHGTPIQDDYRWLESANDPAVRKWTEEQNRRTRAVLEQYRALPAIREQVKELVTASSSDYAGLRYQGGKLFALKSQPPKEQPLLVTLRSPDDISSEQVVLDPNTLNAKGTTTIDFYEPALDGNLVAVSLSSGGTEEGDIHIYEATTGKKLADVIPRVSMATAGGSLAWNAGSTGFYYTRYPHEGERPKEDLNFYQQVYFHRLGTPASEDSYSMGKDLPRIAEIMLDSSEDGKYILATVQNGDGGEFAHYVLGPDGEWTQVTHFADRITAATFGPDQALYLLSLNGAPRGRILRLPLATPTLSKAETVVEESENAIQGLRLGSSRFYTTFVATPGRLYVISSAGGPSLVRAFDHRGRQQDLVSVLPVSSVSEIVRLNGDEILFRNQSFTQPPAWYRYDPATGKTTGTALYRTSPADFSGVEVRREFTVSKDGTRVPLNILMRKGTEPNGRNPTLLTGYGGFGSNQVPTFSVSRKIWLDQGGICAIANLRGGNEYGAQWHAAGSLTHKQNVFDDFAACAQLLIDRNYTNPEKLAIEGGSNGGLLMGAALTQHPELFRGVVAHVGIFDMLLHDRHPNGAFNVTEYGTVKEPEQFKAIYAYSPYHHVKKDTSYPAVFFTTGANDGRVDPANSRKMAARLQAATSSRRPVLLQISFDSGHGLGTALSKTIDRQADVYAFLFQQLGIEYKVTQH